MKNRIFFQLCPSHIFKVRKKDKFLRRNLNYLENNEFICNEGNRFHIINNNENIPKIDCLIDDLLYIDS